MVGDLLGPMTSGSGRAQSRMYSRCRLNYQYVWETYLAGDTRYWMFLAYFIAGLSFIQICLPPIAQSEFYINCLGYIGLTVEATLPLPQILANHQSRSCKGFRLSVVAAWILGDLMKLSYFFCSQEVIPWAFRLCALFQCVCDLYLGVQFWMYSKASFGAAGSPREPSGNWTVEEKDIRMT